MLPTKDGHAHQSIVDRFAVVCAKIAKILPFGLNKIIPPNLIGFALINGFTFAVDLALLTVMHGWLQWNIAVSMTVAYVCAFGLSFVLNRWMNFRSHAPVGRQAVLYAVAVGINYVAFILGVGGGLTELGVQYHLSRLIAGACEGIYMYSVMRWIIFRRQPGEPRKNPEPQLAEAGE